MSARDLTIADIKALLIERLDGLVAELAPDLRSKGDIFTGKSPLRVDRHGGSFVVWRRGRVAGGWKDYATDESGDVLDLVACCACGCSTPPVRDDRVKAIQWAKSWLGVTTQNRAEIERVREKAVRQQKESEARELLARKARRRRAFELWMDGKPIWGSPVETYLRGRGVALERIENWDDGLRYAPRLDHWIEKHVGPAMLAAFRHPAQGFCGLHATFLRPDGSGKADVDKAKLMLGTVSGCAIHLTQGSSALRLEYHERFNDVQRASPLALTEGIEDGCSVAAADPDLRVWAVGSLSNIGVQPNSSAVSSFVLCADNDWATPTAVAAFEKARLAIEKHGKPVVVARAHRGKDFNDLARD